MTDLNQGDVVWVNFTSSKGHVQGGRRPALVISKSPYSLRSGLAIVCPITSKVKGYPCEVPILCKISGVVLSDHIQTIDIIAHGVELIDQAHTYTTQAVLENIANIFY